MRKFCPKCGAFMDKEASRSSRWSFRCHCCHTASLESEFLTVAGLGKELQPPADTGVKFIPDNVGNAVLSIPRIGVTGVHWALFVFAAAWFATFALGLAAAYFVEGFLKGFFIVLAAGLAIPPLIVILGLINSMKESQEIEVTHGGIRVTKSGPLFSRSRTISFDDLDHISLRPCSPMDPIQVSRFMLHFSGAEDADQGILLPTIGHGHHRTAVGDFLSNAEKRWLVWLLKKAVYTKTEKCV